MAEALLRARSGGTVAADSAGSRLTPIRPDAVAVMAERGIDLHDTRASSPTTRPAVRGESRSPERATALM